MAGAILPFIFTATAAVIGGLGVPAALATAFIITAGAYFLAPKDRRRRTTPPPLAERTTLVRLANPPRRVIYGETTFAPSVFHIDSHGDRVVVACAIADHAVEAITEVLIDGGRFMSAAECSALTADGTVTIPTSDPPDLSSKRTEAAEFARGASLSFLMKAHAGLDASGNFSEKMEQYDVPPIIGLNNWSSSNMKGVGLSWIVFELPRNHDATKRSPWDYLPQIQVRVRRGKAGMESFAGSDLLSADNPALVLYDYAKKYTGFGDDLFGEARIDIPSFQATATYCETRGWSAVGVLDLGTAPDGSMAAIAQAAISAAVCDIGGKLHFKHRTSVGQSTPCFGENDIVQWQITPFAPRDDRQSGASVEYVRHDASTGLEVIETASLVNPVARANVGEVNQDISTAMVNNRTQALLIAQNALAKEHDSYLLEADMNARGLTLKPHDLFELRLPDLGLQSKYFRVLNVEIKPQFLIGVQAIEEPINLVEEIDLHAQEYIPPLHPNYHHAGILLHGHDGGGELKINPIGDPDTPTDRVKIIYQ